MKNNGKVWYVGGSVERVNNFLPFDFLEYRKSPQEVKQMYKDKGWTKILGFQTRNPMHRSHYELTKYALEQVGEGAKLLLHPVVGVTQDCDIDYHLRTRCYVELIKKYGENEAELCLLPLCMRMAGPREALWHALIRQNYGCTHFVVGRDHAGPSFTKKNGEDFFGPYDAHELLEKCADQRTKILMPESTQMKLFVLDLKGKLNYNPGKNSIGVYESFFIACEKEFNDNQITFNEKWKKN